MKRELLLLFLLALSNASLVWQFSTDGPVYAKPVVFQGAVIVASQDGNIYALDPVAGSKRWQAVVGKNPNEVLLYENTLIISTTSGKVVRVGNNGQIQWELNLNVTPHNVSYIYGASANPKAIYVSANNGIYVVEKNGSLKTKLVSFNDSVVSPPVAGADFVIFGRGRDLSRVSETGQTQWKSSMAEGSFWLSRPVIDGNTVFVGALDDRLHAYVVSNGIELWNARAKNWIVSTPTIRDGVAFFGSNDGNVYAADTSTGFYRWSAQTALAVQSQPEIGVMGGREAVFAGGTDKSVYAIDKQTGSIVWKGPAGGTAGSPLFYQNSIIFGSSDGKVYSYSSERACSLVTPREAQVVGTKELVVSGSFVSEAGSANVQVQINDGPWENANTTESGWVYLVDPKAKLVTGLNTISCKVSDAAGEESGPTFTTVAINHDPSIPSSQLVVTISPNIIEGTNFTIFVNDADDGSPVDRFDLVFEGKTYRESKNVTLTAPAAGTYQATVKKIGFNDATINVNVNSSGISPVVLGIGILLIVIIIWQVWSRFLKQKFAAKKR